MNNDTLNVRESFVHLVSPDAPHLSSYVPIPPIPDDLQVYLSLYPSISPSISLYLLQSIYLYSSHLVDHNPSLDILQPSPSLLARDFGVISSIFHPLLYLYISFSLPPSPPFPLSHLSRGRRLAVSFQNQIICRTCTMILPFYLLSNPLFLSLSIQMFTLASLLPSFLFLSLSFPSSPLPSLSPLRFFSPIRTLFLPFPSIALFIFFIYFSWFQINSL